jgi:heme/copper-type cytochrome/quinol oxidase subunit 1
MTKRNFAYLLIGFGAGLLVSVAAIIEFVVWFHHMFIVGLAWRPGSVVLALPFVMIFVGLAFLVRDKTQPKSN